jgi:hypothetical protein
MAEDKQEPNLAHEDPLTGLRETARSNYERVSPPRRSNWGWVVLILLVLGILSFLIWGIYSRLTQMNQQANQAAQQTQAIAAGEATLLALQAQIMTATAEVNQVAIPAVEATALPQTGLAANLSAIARAMAGNPLFAPLIFNGGPPCGSANDISIEIVSGPQLLPEPGGTYKSSEAPTAQAIWTVRNSGRCSWTSLSLYSIRGSQGFRPVVRRGGEPVDQNNLPGGVLAHPGETIEVIVEYPGDEARSINEEWAFQINGQLLLAQTHLALAVEDWVIAEKPPKKKPVTGGGGAPPGGGGGGGGQPVATAPANRPTSPPP